MQTTVQKMNTVTAVEITATKLNHSQWRVFRLNGVAIIKDSTWSFWLCVIRKYFT